MAGFFLARWRGLGERANADRTASESDGHHAWRGIAVMLADELHSPLSEIKRLSLAEAADYADVVNRRREAERKALADAYKNL